MNIRSCTKNWIATLQNQAIPDGYKVLKVGYKQVTLLSYYDNKISHVSLAYFYKNIVPKVWHMEDE